MAVHSYRNCDRFPYFSPKIQSVSLIVTDCTSLAPAMDWYICPAGRQMRGAQPSDFLCIWASMVDFSLLLAVIAAPLVLWTFLRRNKRQLPLPPGPKRKFLIGNLLDWPSNSKEWERFAEWHERYGG